MSRKFNATTPRPKHGEEGKSWWHNVGNAYENDKGQIMIYLDSVPVPDPTKNNQVVIMLFEKKDDDRAGDRRNSEQRTQSAGRTAAKTASADDDEIPF